MTSLTTATRFNVEATLNKWLFDALSAFTRPAWLTTMPAFVFNAEEITASLPCFAITHIPAGMADLWQGRAVGDGYAGRRALGLLSVSCYVTRTANPNWTAQLRTMRDMVSSTATASRTVVIQEYQADPVNPTATTFKINLEDTQETPTEADPNPAIERARVLITYSFTFRAN